MFFCGTHKKKLSLLIYGILLNLSIMKNAILFLFCFCISIGSSAQKLPGKRDVIQALESANNYYMLSHPIPYDSIKIGTNYPSNIWVRSIYFEGLMALYTVAPRSRYLDYTMEWGQANNWNFNNGNHTRNADDLCCGQTYIDLYRLTQNEDILGNVTRTTNNIIIGTTRTDWTNISALQMGLPILAKMGTEKSEMRYFKAMMEYYIHLRNNEAQIGLFNEIDGLWWRDCSYIPPYKEPNGESCYWSRGNGWVYAALVRSIDEIELAMKNISEQDKAELKNMRDYLKKDFIKMSLSLLKLQRQDGFWNVSLKDSLHYGGKELTGTALFTYGMAWGIRKNWLAPSVFLPVIIKSWNGMTTEAQRTNGSLAYIQGIGKEPSEGQPVSFDHTPEPDDYAYGCFLLAGSEIVKLIQ